MSDIQPLGWHAKTVADIAWALSVIADAQKRVAAIEAQYEAAAQKLHLRREELVRKALGDAAYLESEVVAWTKEHRSEVVTGRRKSLETLHGSVGFRTVPGKLTVVDEEALKVWLLTTDPTEGLYRMEVRPNLKELKARVEKDGVIPPGTEWVEQTETVQVKPVALPTLDNVDVKELP